MSEDRYLVSGLIRGLDVLQAFTPERPELSLSEIAGILGISRSAAFRPVYTLASLGFLLQDRNSQRYSLGPAVLRLGYGYLATRELVEIALPVLETLRDQSGWSAHLGVRDGRTVLYMLRVPALSGLDSIVHVGSRLPASATTMGRVLLAGLRESEVISLYRDEDFSRAPGRSPRSQAALLAQWNGDLGAKAIVQVGEFEAGMASIAAPVRDMTGDVAAAVNLTRTFSERPGPDQLSGIEALVTEAAARLSGLLGWQEAKRQM
ncbi:IclR family transcriptional regulator [Leisingera methylohalidivorans]|uniref:IclR family transcriptional regulator n=1 Tax=Leisingera methylohalidivorans DSM 14336 TaxID=999552 RepID=V9VX47_9RHOB|nr:IclR family transcriptional regulator [Leisingera methylohalidivorans]AHD01940.1 IclR family transcriptional regulator [Leisingera methylohalidivorans DSM 14336]